ncbi:MAG: hypothetical protein LBG15_07950 [Dysgonamonadaceae bacterium]|jgi:hypothetical protein|nr:hypothetical protein [Dysgonamonadaceae bacterium]
MNERILDGMTVKEAITRCGELLLPYEQVVRLIADLSPSIHRAQLLADLASPGTDAYEYYQSGVAEGNLKLNIDLEHNVSDPKAKDAYRHLSSERRRQAINKKQNELFGI